MPKGRVIAQNSLKLEKVYNFNAHLRGSRKFKRQQKIQFDFWIDTERRFLPTGSEDLLRLSLWTPGSVGFGEIHSLSKCHESIKDCGHRETKPDRLGGRLVVGNDLAIAEFCGATVARKARARRDGHHVT